MSGVARHGHSTPAGKSKTYQSWQDMRARCARSNHSEFKRYGGRGIRVCDRWQIFENFLADMGECPAGLTLDRKDNDGNYEPGNCRWATRREQSRNTRSTRLYTLHGEKLCLRAWEERLGLGYGTLANRLRRGWAVERALSTPKQPPWGGSP